MSEEKKPVKRIPFIYLNFFVNVSLSLKIKIKKKFNKANIVQN